MTEDDLELFFETGGKGATVKRFTGHWEATVFSLDDDFAEGEGEGDTMLEALGDAIVNYEYCER